MAKKAPAKKSASAMKRANAPKKNSLAKPARKPASKERQVAAWTGGEDRVLRLPPVYTGLGAVGGVDLMTALAVGRAANLGGGQFEPKLPRAVIRCTTHGCGFVRASELVQHLRTQHGVPMHRGSCADCGDLLFPKEILKGLPPPGVLSAFRQHSRKHPLGGDFTGIEPA